MAHRLTVNGRDVYTPELPDSGERDDHRGLCSEASPHRGLICTLYLDHGPPVHVASTDERVVEIWSVSI